MCLLNWFLTLSWWNYVAPCWHNSLFVLDIIRWHLETRHKAFLLLFIERELSLSKRAWIAFYHILYLNVDLHGLRGKQNPELYNHHRWSPQMTSSFKNGMWEPLYIWSKVQSVRNWISTLPPLSIKMWVIQPHFSHLSTLGKCKKIKNHNAVA